VLLVMIVELLNSAVEAAIRGLLPMKMIVQAFIGPTVQGNNVRPGEMDDDDIEVSDEDETSDESMSPVAAPAPAPVPSPVQPIVQPIQPAPSPGQPVPSPGVQPVQPPVQPVQSPVGQPVQSVLSPSPGVPGIQPPAPVRVVPGAFVRPRFMEVPIRPAAAIPMRPANPIRSTDLFSDAGDL
jgi:hypothetical protein